MPETQQIQEVFQPEALLPTDGRLALLGSYMLASSHLIDGGDVSETPQFKVRDVDGAIDELRENRDSKDYISAYYDEGIKLAELLIASGDMDKSHEIMVQLAYNLTEDGGFKDAIEKGYLSDEQLYSLMSVAARSNPVDIGYYFGSITGKKPTNFKIGNDGETNGERVSTERMLQLAASDPNKVNGMKVMSMYGVNLARGLSGVKRGDPGIKNDRILKTIIESFGFEEYQASNIFDALGQSSDDEYYRQMSSRVEGALNLFTELRSNSESDESYRLGVQRLYRTFGIRNFNRYSAQDVTPQLQDDYAPEELVVSAVYDYSGVLSNPANSARGLRYKHPAYFEASSTLDLVKSLVTARQLRGRGLENILIRAHSDSDGFSLSNEKYGSINTTDLVARGEKAGWERELIEKGIIDKDAEVVFESCSLGAGGFPKSFFERTGIKPLTAVSNIIGSAAEGYPGVVRLENGDVKFGTSPFTGHRDADGLTSPAEIE